MHKESSSHDLKNIIDDEIDLNALLHVIWNGKWLILLISSLFAISSIIYALNLPNQYKSEATLVSASGSSNSLSGLANQLGGLASLAGLSNNDASSDNYLLALEIIKSKSFITNFINKHKLEVVIAAAIDWDEQNKKWILDSKIYNLDSNEWVRNKKPKQPSNLELYEILIKRLQVSSDENSGITKIGFELFSPEKAQEWSSMIIQDINSYMKNRDVAEAQESINYLKQQLEKTPVTEMQKIFYQLIAEQTKKIMLANARDDYIFKIIDPPITPENKSAPKRALIVIGSTMVGIFLGVLLILLRHTSVKYKN